MIRRKKVIYVLLVFVCNFCFAQKHDYVWVFGDSAGIDFNNVSNPLAFTSVLRSAGNENYASIADKNGVLQFYIAGEEGPLNLFSYNHSKIFNGSFQAMENGDSLTTHRSMTQGTLIIPFPGDTNKYVLFYSQNVSLIGYPPLGLYYAIIDMSFNNGLGKVLIKDSLIIGDTLTEKLTAIKHGNGRDWWIITHESNSKNFYKFLLTPNSIFNMPSQKIGTKYLNSNNIEGQMVFSPNGAYLCCVGNNIIDLFNFNRCTGIISNWKDLYTGNNSYYGCAISPDESKLYVTTDYSFPISDTLFQFDLNSSNIVGSKASLFTSEPNYLLGGLAIGPDNKIYFPLVFYQDFSNIFSTYNMSLSVINNPNGTIASCNLTPYSFYLGGRRTSFNLPNMVNYRLGKDEGSVCDTILGMDDLQQQLNFVAVYPNPVKDYITVDFYGKQNKASSFSLFNSLGEEVRQITIEKNVETRKIFIKDLEQGVYFWKVYDGGNTIQRGKVCIISE